MKIPLNFPALLLLGSLLGCSPISQSGTTTATTPRTSLHDLLSAPVGAVEPIATQLKAQWARLGEFGISAYNYNLGIDHLAAMRNIQLFKEIIALRYPELNMDWLDLDILEERELARRHFELAKQEVRAELAKSERSTQRAHDSLISSFAIFGAVLGGIAAEAEQGSQDRRWQMEQRMYQEQLLLEQRRQTEALRQLQPPYRPSACNFGAPNLSCR